MTSSPLPRIVTASDRKNLASAVARELLPILVQDAREHSADCPFEWAIAGGVVHDVLADLASIIADEDDLDADWSHIRVWWVDERFVQATHSERNDQQAVSALFAQLPGIQLRPMPSDRGQGLDQAAEDYADLWRSDIGDGVLDFALIGMGPDGHIASLFPGRAHEADGAPVLVVRDSPKMPPLRLSLPMSTIASARDIWVVAPGDSKADALAEALVLGAHEQDRPIAGLPRDRSTFWLDTDSARGLEVR